MFGKNRENGSLVEKEIEKSFLLGSRPLHLDNGVSNQVSF